MSTDEFDFKEQAKALLKRVGQNPTAPLNSGLALAAVEAALREAYARGASDSKGRPALSKTKAPASRAAEVEAPRDCAHEWEEVFLDGRALGSKCLNCGILQREVQDRCDHYFVSVDGAEVCVACRKPRRAPK